jgi:hypothetical protein
MPPLHRPPIHNPPASASRPATRPPVQLILFIVALVVILLLAEEVGLVPG